ncbi:hypothetical protein E2320_017064 [Naja naja]|nr:hypothetical protein E2320_017064 [Naja naja]
MSSMLLFKQQKRRKHLFQMFCEEKRNKFARTFTARRDNGQLCSDSGFSGQLPLLQENPMNDNDSSLDIRAKEENTLSFLPMDWMKRCPRKPLQHPPSFTLTPHPEGQQESPCPPGCCSWSPPGLSSSPANDSIKAKSKALCNSIRWLKHRLQPSSLRLGELTRGTLSFPNQKYFVFLTHGLEEGLASEASASWTRLSSDSSSRRSAKESRSHRLLESTRTVSESCKRQY